MSDSTIPFSKYVSSLWRLAKINRHALFCRSRSLLLHNVLTKLDNALVSSRINHCNLLLIGITNGNLNKVKMVQNSLARPITKTQARYNHITVTLHYTHWLPLEQRIHFKIFLFVHKVTANRNSINATLAVPHNRTLTGSWVLSVAGPKLWKLQPSSVWCHWALNLD